MWIYCKFDLKNCGLLCFPKCSLLFCLLPTSKADLIGKNNFSLFLNSASSLCHLLYSEVKNGTCRSLLLVQTPHATPFSFFSVLSDFLKISLPTKSTQESLMFLLGSSLCIYLVSSDPTSSLIFPLKFFCTPHTHCLWCEYFVVLDLQGSQLLNDLKPCELHRLCCQSYLFGSFLSPSSAPLLFREVFSVHGFLFLINSQKCNNTKHMVASVTISASASCWLHIVLLCDAAFQSVCVSFRFPQTFSCWGCTTSVCQSFYDDLCLQWELCSERSLPGCRRKETTRLRNAVNVACVFV